MAIYENAPVIRFESADSGWRLMATQGSNHCPEMHTTAADLARLERRMRDEFDARFPQLAGLAFQYAWSGHLCLTRNAASVMRELEPGLLSACVQSGFGTARGALTGIGAAELACGQASHIMALFLAEAEPVRLPPPADRLAQ